MRRLVGLLTVIIVGAAGGYGGYEMWTGEPNEIRLYLDQSSYVVSVNEPFLLEVEVENVDVDIASDVHVNAVGLDQSLLNGLAVDDMTLIIAGQEIPQAPGDWTDYKLDQSLAGGGKMTIRYTLRATQPGTYQGDVSVWVDSELVAGIERSKPRAETIRIQVQ
jgi:hypothetical protein